MEHNNQVDDDEVVDGLKEDYLEAGLDVDYLEAGMDEDYLEAGMFSPVDEIMKDNNDAVLEEVVKDIVWRIWMRNVPDF